MCEEKYTLFHCFCTNFKEEEEEEEEEEEVGGGAGGGDVEEEQEEGNRTAITYLQKTMVYFLGL